MTTEIKAEEKVEESKIEESKIEEKIREFSFNVKPERLGLQDAVKRVILSESCGLGVGKTQEDINLLVNTLEAEISVWLDTIGREANKIQPEEKILVNPFLKVVMGEKTVKFSLASLKSLQGYYSVASEGQRLFNLTRKDGLDHSKDNPSHPIAKRVASKDDYED